MALKVQRPDCERVVALDLFVLRWWARLGTSFFVRAFGRDLDLVSVVDDFGALIYREIDYRAEARNARQFAKLYRGRIRFATGNLRRAHDVDRTISASRRVGGAFTLLRDRVHLTMTWVVSC